MKIGTEVTFCTQKNMAPSGLRFECTERHATGCLKVHILKIYNNFNSFYSIFIKIRTEIGFCTPNDMAPSEL